MDKAYGFGKFAESLGCTVLYGETMRLHTTFKTGGNADVFITVSDEESLTGLCRRAAAEDMPVFILGNGSNVLVDDKGVRGAVISLGGKFKDIRREGGEGIACGAGASLASVCTFAQKCCLSGMEFAWGIPGSAGGGAFMNAGAYGHSISEVIFSCEYVKTDGTKGTLSGDKLDFGYRHSAFSGGGYIITFLHLKLKSGDRDKISEQMAELLGRRKAKQPLDLPSAGSVFKRPEGHFAGKLIEECGLKGRSVGGAAVSEKHAGFIVNKGNATSGDIEELIKIIQDTVYGRTGVKLECEIKFIG